MSSHFPTGQLILGFVILYLAIVILFGERSYDNRGV